MPESKYPDLTSFKALSFDCYGTIIDWETGLFQTIRHLTSQLPQGHPMREDPPKEALQRFDSLVMALEESQPTMPNNEINTSTLQNLAKELNVSLSDTEAVAFGNSFSTWKPFVDSVAALQTLRMRFKLIILSNVDNANMQATLRNQLGEVPFDAAYTAQDIDSYKPSLRNFAYLFEHAKSDLGIDKDKGDLLHVACSLKVDHMAAKQVGLRSCWISRGGKLSKDKGYGGGDLMGGLDEYKEKVAHEWQFDTLSEFAEEVERQFAAKGL